MKKINFSFYLMFLFTVLSVHAMAQNDQRAILDQIAGRLAQELNSNKAEWMYVHHDKPYYPAGSTIWFKIYNIREVNRQISDNANNIYIDLVNKEDSIVQLAVLNSSAREWDGGLKIPSRLEEGFYTLRAYNTDITKTNPDNCFREHLFIFNPGRDTLAGTAARKSPEVNTSGEPVINFFPEGGSLVNGIENVIYVTSKTAQGKAVSIEGRIYDDNNRLIAPFRTSESGSGQVSFSPVKNRKYTAVVNLGRDSEKRISLPPINYNASQITLVKQDEKSLKLRVVLGDSLYSGKPASYLLGFSRGKLCYASIGTGMYETDVPLKNFPSGVATFYLFDEQQKKTSERKVFIHKKDLVVTIKPERENYAARQKINTEIQITDEAGSPVKAIFSVSVTDDRYILPERNVKSLNDYRSLSDADLVRIPELLPQHSSGMADFSDSSLYIAGNIKKKTGDPAAGFILTLFAGTANAVLADTTGNDGRFLFPDMEFKDGTPFLVQVNDEKGARQEAVVETDFNQFPVLPEFREDIKPAEIPAGVAKFKAANADSFLTGRTKVWLEEIVVRAGSNQKERSPDVKRNTFSRMITSEQLDKLGLSNTVNAVMMLPGVIMVSGRLTIRGGMQVADSRGGGLSGGMEPLLLIDGVPSGGQSVVNTLNAINPQTIESIEVLTGGDAGQYGTRGANGVILLKTANRLRPVATGDQKGMMYIYPKGYHVRPGFFTPPYDVYEIRDAEFSDNRATLYWNSEIITDIQGKAAFGFYSADQPATYTMRVVGVTSKGDLIDQAIKINRN